MTVSRAFMNLACADPQRSRDFYVALLGYAVQFQSDWFIHLGHPSAPLLELGLMHRDSELLPESERCVPRGAMLSFVVDDVDAVHERAKAMAAPIVEAPRDLFYGQRRLLLRDPEGALVDVSAPCDPDPEWLSRVRARPGGGHVEDSPSPSPSPNPS